MFGPRIPIDLNERIASLIERSSEPDEVRCIGEVTDRHQNSTTGYFVLTDATPNSPV